MRLTEEQTQILSDLGVLSVINHLIGELPACTEKSMIQQLILTWVERVRAPIEDMLP